jgi:hypothetical protein
MVRGRPKVYRFEAIIKVKQFEDLAKSAVEAPQKIWLRRTAVTMPASAKKSTTRRGNSETDMMPNIRQTESARKGKEAAAMAPALPPRMEPTVPMLGGPKPTPQKRKGDDNLKR